MKAHKKAKTEDLSSFTEQDRIKAINLMADEMERTARHIGPRIDCIGGDKFVLAETALDALLKNFKITK